MWPGKARASMVGRVVKLAVVAILTSILLVNVWVPGTATNTPTARTDPTGSSSACTTTIQALVDAAAPNTVVAVPPCVYRETVKVTKSITLDGQGAAEIRGSDVWTEWTTHGDFWRSSRSVPPVWTSQRCKEGTIRCEWPSQAFIDGVPLHQVAADPISGQFAVDSDRRVILADQPLGRVVEVTTRERWVEGEAGNVTIRGFRMRHAFGIELGALWNGYGQANWVIEDNVLSDVHRTVVYLGGLGHQLLGNDISRGGVEGVGLGGADMLISGNRIHHNNTEGADPFWEAGGLKAARSDRITVEGNEVDHNDGPGIWCDWDCDGWTIRNNRVHHNSANGAILYEVASDGRIYGNALWENGWGDPRRLEGPAIALANAIDTDVYGNTLAWNNAGIVISSMDRDPAYNAVTGNNVHDNIIVAETGSIALAWVEGFDGVLLDPAFDNRGVGNAYWYPVREGADERFWWDDPLKELAVFNTTPGEEGGYYLTTAEKDDLLATVGIPVLPEPRGDGRST